LDALRRKDPGGADELFLKSLQNLAEQPSADPYQLLMAGYYIFLPDQSTLVVVVRGHLIFNFSGVNPLASPTVIRAYFELAVNVLSRPAPPSPNPGLTQSFKEGKYIAGCVLLPFAKTYAPEKASQLEGVMRDLAPSIPADVTEEAIHAKIDAAGPTSMNNFA